jgi:CII-binding regulator of phage lambda lysogenization HflD
MPVPIPQNLSRSTVEPLQEDANHQKVFEILVDGNESIQLWHQACAAKLVLQLAEQNVRYTV